MEDLSITPFITLAIPTVSFIPINSMVRPDEVILTHIFRLGTAVAGPDVILQGADTFIQYTSVAQPDTNAYFQISVKMVETEFTNPASDRVTREEFMQVLQNLTGIFIKASYVDRGDITEYDYFFTSVFLILDMSI